MKVTLCDKSFDRIVSPVATLPFFSDRRPLRETMGLADWRMNGRLSRLIEENKVNGAFGETVFIPTQGRLSAETLILYGLGDSRRWDPNRAESAFMPWIERLESLNHPVWLASFSALSHDFLMWRQCVRIFVNSLAYRSKPMCQELYLVETLDCIQETKKRRMDFGEIVELDYDLVS